MPGLSDQLVFVDRVGVELHDRVEAELGFVSEGRQHVQQVGHAAAGSLIEVGHERRSTAPGSYGGPPASPRDGQNRAIAPLSARVLSLPSR